MARLSQEVRIFMIHRCAEFDAPSMVVAAVQKEYGVAVTKQTVESHDPTKAGGKGLAKKWKAIFERSRERFLDDVSSICIAHKAVRLRRLDRMATKAEDMKNLPMAAALLEQAAKEMGEAYTNRRQLQHSNPDGSMKPPAPVVVTAADVAEAVKALGG